MLSYFLFALVSIYIFMLFKRAKKYKYDVSKDYMYNLEKNVLLKTDLHDNSIILPKNFKEYDSLFLGITLSFHPLSLFFKPWIKIESTNHYFEYAAQGKRYLNISNLQDEKLFLISKNIHLKTTEMTIYGYKNNIHLSEKILILAPHADDAEIAAFGLYKQAQDVTIVTTTAGESGVCNYCDMYDNNHLKQSLKKGELRVFDALCVPLLGNVAIQNSLTLGYFGGTLQWMRGHKNEQACSFIKGIDEMNNFRKVSHAHIKLPLNVKPIYEAFHHDLQEIITQLKPDIIITPHPAIDSHPDHKQTSLTLFEVLQETHHECKLLLYTNHLQLSESYPLGKMYASVTLPPNKNAFYFDSLYSFALDKELQIDKFFALESIHDLRDSLLFISIKKSLKHLNKMIKRELTGKDKSYYKRAVRANELFFVVESKNIEKLLEI